MADSPRTGPKPFVFVLMPFEDSFDDIYKFGIKGAADDAGAYAERVDEQMFVEGILDRVFNQISKADVIVADMTGRNPNVFYEVGYAHALDKIVLLLTQSPEDIPFDLKQRPHVVYRGSIEHLRSELGRRLKWALSENEARRLGRIAPAIEVRLAGVQLQSDDEAARSAPTFYVTPDSEHLTLTFGVVNCGPTAVAAITHVYMLFEESAPWRPATLETSIHTGSSFISSLGVGIPVARPTLGTAPDGPEGLTETSRIPTQIYALEIPVGAIEEIEVVLAKRRPPEVPARYALRLHVGPRMFDYQFQLEAAKTVSGATPGHADGHPNNAGSAPPV